jgi:hypothetical protein
VNGRSIKKRSSDDEQNNLARAKKMGFDGVALSLSLEGLTVGVRRSGTFFRLAVGFTSLDRKPTGREASYLSPKYAGPNAAR